MKLQQYRIATRISAVVGIILAMMLVLVVVEMRGLNAIRASLDEIVGTHYERLQTAQEMRFLARHSAVVVRNVLLVSTEEQRQHERARFEKGAAEYAELQRWLASQRLADEEQQLVDQVLEGGQITFELWRLLIDEELRGGAPENRTVLFEAEVRNRQWGLLDSLNNLVRLEQLLAEQSMAEARQSYNNTKSVMAMINILAVGAGLFLVAAITASIVGPLHEIARRVDRIAGGDLTTRIDLDQEDEVGQLASHINRMVEKLQSNEDELKEYRYHLEELIEWRTGQVNDQRERFISVLIHDLKGALIPILGFSRLLTKKSNLTATQVSDYARAIHESTRKLESTIERTSQELREKRLASSFDREPFAIDELLGSVSLGLLPSLLDGEIELRINGQQAADYTPTGSVLFHGDIGKIRSLLENLLGNAAKYAEALIEVVFREEDGRVEVMVDDDGPGVAESFRKRIFEEYYQVPGSRKGTGIGLYSVKRIVDYYQGRVTVTDSPLGGARFIISLPLEQEVAPPVAASA